MTQDQSTYTEAWQNFFFFIVAANTNNWKVIIRWRFLNLKCLVCKGWGGGVFWSDQYWFWGAYCWCWTFVCFCTWALHSQNHPNWVRRFPLCLFSITQPHIDIDTWQTHSDFRDFSPVSKRWNWKFKLKSEKAGPFQALQKPISFVSLEGFKYIL